MTLREKTKSVTIRFMRLSSDEELWLRHSQIFVLFSLFLVCFLCFMHDEVKKFLKISFLTKWILLIRVRIFQPVSVSYFGHGISVCTPYHLTDTYISQLKCQSL